MIRLPKVFIKNIIKVHKEKGEKWLRDFQSLIHECEQRWQLRILDPFELSYNFVAPAIRKDGTQMVIKLAVPGEEFLTEVKALQLFKGNGMVQMLDVDKEKGILILERIRPGTNLASLENDEEATTFASQVMKKLWIPAPKYSNLPTMVHREKQLIQILMKHPQGIGPITGEWLQEAVETFHSLNELGNQPFLLHGDLHHYNILQDRHKSWIAIDPKGLIGDREYDVIQFLLNKLPSEHLTTVIERRIDILVQELNLDKKRILLWGFAHTVLATCWSIEDHGDYNETFFQAIHVFKHLNQ
jgi:streptomycin 6-kinase